LETGGRSWDNYLRTEFIEKPIGQLPRWPPQRVLDVGAGTSRFVDNVFPQGYQLVRIDVTRNARNHVACSVTNLPFRDEAFDFVLVFRVLQHVPRETDALEELLRVTKSGGRVILSLANRDSWTLLGARLANPRWRRRIPYSYYRLYRRAEFEGWLRQGGLIHIRIWSAVFLPEAINRLPLTVARGLIRLGVVLDRIAAWIPFVRNMGTNWVAIGVKG